MLVDTGSSADILYLQAYDRLGLPRKHLKLVSTPITGFTVHSLYPTRIVKLDLTKKAQVCYQLSIPRGMSLREPPRQKRYREGRHPVMKLNKKETSKENDLRERESEKRGKPHEELELIPFREADSTKTFKLGTRLSPQHREGVVALV
ncbi:hypothetical protein LIER_43043 [Lithospermum erythrorhizon]|uniref:Uncharacterized protein n=1 Tax=Lithospermum erythrorhizon TaxID=34254 RepID=A0AAV3PG83_LITER